MGLSMIVMTKGKECFVLFREIKKWLCLRRWLQLSICLLQFFCSFEDWINTHKASRAFFLDTICNCTTFQNQEWLCVQLHHLSVHLLQLPCNSGCNSNSGCNLVPILAADQLSIISGERRQIRCLHDSVKGN